jgi:hypothetical protein
VQDQRGLSGRRRAAILLAAIAIIVVAYLLISSGGNDDKTGGSTTVRVVDAKPDGGIKKLAFKKGDQVQFTVVSDTADEIHVHGYDLMKDVPKGGTVSFSFKGSIEGRFVVELEDHKQQIAELDVTP